MSNCVAGTEGHTTTDGAHGLDDAPLSLEPRRQIGRVAVRADQGRHELEQALLGLGVTLFIRKQAAQGFDTMVHGTHAGAQPDPLGSRRGQLGVEHYQARVPRRWLEQAFSIAAVVPCHARDALVLAPREAGWDGDVADHGVLVVSLESEELLQAFGIRNRVGEHPRDHLGRVRQRPGAQRDDDVGVLRRGVLRDLEDFVPVRVRRHADPQAHDFVAE